MSLLPRKSALAIAAVTDVALNARMGALSGKALAKSLHLPSRHLEPLLQALTREGILKAVGGRMAAMCSPATSAESPRPTSCARPEPWMTKAKSRYRIGIARSGVGLDLGKGGEHILGLALAHQRRGPGTLDGTKIARHLAAPPGTPPWPRREASPLTLFCAAPKVHFVWRLQGNSGEL